jgi:hypothetical protein
MYPNVLWSAVVEILILTMDDLIQDFNPFIDGDVGGNGDTNV